MSLSNPLLFGVGDHSHLLSESRNVDKSPRSLEEGQQEMMDSNQREEMGKEPEEGDKVKTKLITMWNK
jgi:hypothetical protein